MDSNTNSTQPPPGYPRLDAEQNGHGKKKKQGCCGLRRRTTTTKRGEASFIEGCIAALCCCWLCELCCD
ncbi:hypothetical protein BDA96_09G126000 [Sorghum bicolor]|uniref:Cysteine-rich transmembrane domain-containing protein n=2 Tax=Sorghum bicolor TaxID=4558 RepID=A0A921Q9W5_SORBI|nr:hypothetical protein BDA96_09G126000 [Sorghum bicolor]KXG21880.1 hypothetical protein SORBI_3009G120200 [Sorghum bicolor]